MKVVSLLFLSLFISKSCANEWLMVRKGGEGGKVLQLIIINIDRVPLTLTYRSMDATAKGTSAALFFGLNGIDAIENYIIKIPLHTAGRPVTSTRPGVCVCVAMAPAQSISLLHSCPISLLTWRVAVQLLLPFKNFKWKTLSATCSTVSVCECKCVRGCVTDTLHIGCSFIIPFYGSASRCRSVGIHCSQNGVQLENGLKLSSE